jgi:hypothetical protein
MGATPALDLCNHFGKAFRDWSRRRRGAEGFLVELTAPFREDREDGDV